MISVVIPVFNEQENIKSLLERLKKTFAIYKKDYEVVLIDDRSTDRTWQVLEDLSSKYPIKILKKEGKKGKAFSLFEGFAKATGEVLVMIDADLQYPPEAISEMIKTLDEADIVIANRKNYYDSKVRKVLSRTFRFAFGKLLFGLDSDIQSGLKVFKREVLETVKFRPKSGWTFDLEFLHRATQAGFILKNVDIDFHPRKNGHSKIDFVKNVWEIGANAISVRLRRVHPQVIPPKFEGSMQGAGIGFAKQKHITHSTLPHHETALFRMVLWQRIFLALILFTVGAGIFISWLNTLIAVIAVLSTIYFLDGLFNFWLIFRSLHFPQELGVSEEQLGEVDNNKLPIYSILCPLYKESKVLPQFLESIRAINWPKDKLDVLLLLEEDDQETIRAVRSLNLPSYVRAVIVPKSSPQTKPKACNYGLSLARGEYLVIYDAEDQPDPQQLKKAFITFNSVDPKIICLQAKLNYYNPEQNLLTRLFTAEYSLWFDVILPGLQSIDTTIPLGGTSNHFRTDDLRNLEGWDPFNVTEDTDLGIRLFKKGYRTAIIDSVTYEEANSNVGNWLRQRSRWIKGYLQTYLVHTRHPVDFVMKHGWHAFIFQLVIGARISFMLINPILWIATIAYFTAYSVVGATIESLYPTAVFYMAVISLVFGNFMYLYNYMIGCAKRGQWSLIKYVFLVPIYWVLASFAAVIALYQLIVKPHFWEKTLHGFHLAHAEAKKEKAELRVESEVRKNVRAQRIRELISSGTFAGGVLVFAAIVGNLLNFLYNAYLGRTIAIEEFGLISVISSIMLLSSIILSSFARTVTHKSAEFLGKYNSAFKQFWATTRKKALVTALVISSAWLVALPTLSTVFKTNSIEPFLLFTPVWFFIILASVDRGYLSGNLKFKVLALIVVLEATLKLLFTVALVETGYTRFIYAAIPVSMSASFVLGWAYARSIKAKAVDEIDKNIAKFPLAFFTTSIFRGISIIAFISLDVILAKIFLSPTAAGQYALISLVGKMIFLIGGLFNQFITPLISREEGAGRDSRKIFYLLFAASTLTSSLTYIVVGYFGHITTPLLFGDKILPVVSFLPLYGLGILSFTTASTIVNYYQTRKVYLFPIVALFITAIQVTGIFLFHQNLSQIVWVMTITGIVSLAIILGLHLVFEPLKALLRYVGRYVNSTSQSPKVQPAMAQKLNILIFNWRDLAHVWSGGAEVYIHEFAKRLVKKGHSVTLFCGNDGKSARAEVVDGIQIIRKGGNFSVYFWAFIYYMFKFRGKYDIIVDSENGTPFFMPLYAREPVIGLVHHIHLKEVYRRHLILPVAVFAQFLETKLMPLVYRNKKMLTVSKSSKEEMENLGFGKKIPIEIVNPGVDLSVYKPTVKNSEPLILYLGRLKPYKSVDTLIKIMKNIRKTVPNAILAIAGEGESRVDLEKYVNESGLSGVVKFLGRVSEKTKVDLLGKAWVVAQPSKSEGWGITVIEANACRTPVVASDIPGLRDSLNNPHSGILVAWDNLEKWTDEISKILRDKNHKEALSNYSQHWAKQFDWDLGVNKLLSIVKGETK